MRWPSTRRTWPAQNASLFLSLFLFASLGARIAKPNGSHLVRIKCLEAREDTRNFCPRIFRQFFICKNSHFNYKVFILRWIRKGLFKGDFGFTSTNGWQTGFVSFICVSLNFYLFIEKFTWQKFVKFSMRKISVSLWKMSLSKILFARSEQNILRPGPFVKSIDQWC